MGRVLHVQDRKEMHTNFSYGNLKARGPLEGLGVGGRIILK
jgi:hypothetical protein